MDEKIQNKINDFWSNKTKKGPSNQRVRWWQSPFIIRSINEKVSGSACNGFSQGLINRAQEYAEGNSFKKAISVGCGNGHKEMNLIQQGLVEDFTLYELAEERIQEGKKLAQAFGIEGKVRFIQGDAFEREKQKASYDFVHWNNSLHHMMNVEEAVKWSYDILQEGGMFYMDDFVGPSRFQWTDKMLEVVRKVRMALPDKYLKNPYRTPHASFLKRIKRTIFSSKKSKALLSHSVNRPTIEQMIAMDPSEAADSSNIIPAIKKYFPQAEITLTGGTVYHLALNDILHNFDEEKDKPLLDLMLIIDDLCAQLGENHYATAIAIKPSQL